jgi:hypothetical protein
MNCSKQHRVRVRVATGQTLSIIASESMCGKQASLRWEGDNDKVASSYRVHTN